MKIQVKEHLTPVVATPSITLTFGLLADVISSLKHQTADRHSNQLVKTMENLAPQQPYSLNELVETRTEKREGNIGLTQTLSMVQIAIVC